LLKPNILYLEKHKNIKIISRKNLSAFQGGNPISLLSLHVES